MPVPRTCHIRDSESDISQETNPLRLIKRAAEGLKDLAAGEDRGGGAVDEYRWMNLTMSIGICTAYEPQPPLCARSVCSRKISL